MIKDKREPSRAAAVVALYEKYLGRLPDGDGLRHYQSSTMSMSQIEAIFAESEEGNAVARTAQIIHDQVGQEGKSHNIMLAGAFGNGNVGDAIMAELIAKNIECSYDIAVFGYSVCDVAPYPFAPNRLLINNGPAIAYGLLNPVVSASFDAIIIGGGGLLAFHHNPIWDPTWAKLVSVPIGLLACGVADPLPADTRSLVQVADFVSSRDVAGVKSLSEIKPDAILCPDPILSLFKSTLHSSMSATRAFILRGPLTKLHKEVRDILKDGDVVIAMEIGVDWPLQALFPSIRFLQSGDQIIDSFGDCGVVISERYHGAILALKAGKAVFGLTRGDHNSSKLTELFNALDATDWCGSSVNLPTAPFPHDKAREHLRMASGIYDSAVRQMLSMFKFVDAQNGTND